jgi:hypothetical protein
MPHPIAASLAVTLQLVIWFWFAKLWKEAKPTNERPSLLGWIILITFLFGPLTVAIICLNPS